MKGKLAVLAAAGVLYLAGGHPGVTASVPVTHSANEALANSMAAAAPYHWTGGQATCLDELWTEESGFSETALNPSSGATGIPQLLPSAHKVPANWSDPRVQVRWGLGYIESIYGTPCRAWAHEKSVTPNWY